MFSQVESPKAECDNVNSTIYVCMSTLHYPYRLYRGENPCAFKLKETQVKDESRSREGKIMFK